MVLGRGGEGGGREGGLAAGVCGSMSVSARGSWTRTPPHNPTVGDGRLNEALLCHFFGRTGEELHEWSLMLERGGLVNVRGGEALGQWQHRGEMARRSVGDEDSVGPWAGETGVSESRKGR